MNHETRERVKFWAITIWWLALVYAIVSGLNYDVSYHENNCYEEVTVQEINKARHRTVWVTLSNGTELELSQPKPAVYPGAPYCVDSRRERNDLELSWWMLPWALAEK